jgi:gluconolactonase
MTLGRDGRLLVCEQGTLHVRARISAFDPVTGDVESLVEEIDGEPLNSPNDIVVTRDGAIWFTDPSYGFLQGFKPEPRHGDNVYRFDGSDVVLVEDSFDKPNGLAFSPDESVLYVGDSGANHEVGSFEPSRPHHIRAFDVVDGGRLENPRVFATIDQGFPDGIKVDSEGRVYSSSFAGVEIYAPDGRPLDRIDLPGAVNFTFGGPASTVLFITADDAIWAALLNATGAEYSSPSAQGA